MPADPTALLFAITLEQPPSVRRQHPALGELAWMIPQYIVGPENDQLRFLFADEQLDRLSQLSPIVFCGDSGTGKTALAVSLAVRWSRLADQRPLTFATGKSFGDDHLEALQADDMEHFRRRYRRCKLLVLDDLEPLATRPAGQDELVNTLDCLSEAERPVIVTSKRLPSSMRGLRSSLASRLSAGFSIDLQHPGSDARELIFKELISAADPSLVVDDLIPLLIDLPVLTKVKQLKELVSIAVHRRQLTGYLDLPSLKNLARQLLADCAPKLINIAKSVSRRFQIRLLDLRGSTRQANVVRARGLAILLARELTSLSLLEIGKFFGDRDHSTIIHAYRKIQLQLPLDVDLALAHNELYQDLIRGVNADD